MANTGKPDSDRQSKAPAEKPAEVPAPAATSSSASEGASGSRFFRLLLSSTARHADTMCKHVRKILNHQRDILSPKAVEEVEASLRETQRSIASRTNDAGLKKQMESLEGAANKWLKPYPNAGFRENVEVLLVALAVAMAVRTFFMQPFKIPTGSMQPTLFGVTSKNLVNEPDFKIPTGLQRIKEWFEGISYIHKVAQNDGKLEIGKPVRLLIFNLWQPLTVDGKSHTIWFPPDFGAGYGGTLEARAGLHAGQVVHKGDEIVRLQVSAGDHLFVDRVSYNFHPPQRGHIVVFETHGITSLDADQQDTFYIKRLVGLGDETLSLQQDHEVLNVPGAMSAAIPVGHLVVNGQPLSASTPHFENLYSFNGASRDTKELIYQENRYFGHALLRDLQPGQDFHVRPGNFFVMGDNTMNSSDSRFWGDFPQEKVIGRSFFVYWPITKRFGWASSHH